jgi:FkbM family methyltransferase
MAIEETLLQISQVLDDINRRLARIEEQSYGAKAVYVGNGRVLTKANILNLIYLLTGDDRLINPRFIMDGIYETEVTHYFLQNIRPGSHCLDVGANFGYHACIMGKCCHPGKTISIEADPIVFELLRDNIMINWINESVIPINAAAAATDGTLTLYRRLTRSGNTSILRIPDEDLQTRLGEAPSEAFEVRALRLDDLLDEFGGRVDFLKVDVEGAEPLVFRGARELIACNDDIKIVMEWSPGNLRGAGFDLASFASDLAAMGLGPNLLQYDGSPSQPVSWGRILESAFINVLLTKRAP